MTVLGDHIDGANFLSEITAYGHLEANAEIMSVKLNYFVARDKDSPEDMKITKFWLYREDAIAFAEAIIRSAKMLNSTPRRPPSDPPSSIA